ncbi:uncharacterized protein LOC119071247 [Bradysia coprophila]|uniref:uncharacterized protein LOC119071247 n=1 Tax=Bradysia coprophila TaxID=38358 RepID=UPI00187D7897|nr:uncharacterized protein LOC119071247 [Bradysia coprophila]
MFTIQVDKLFQQIIKMFYLTGIWQSDIELNSRKMCKKLFFTCFSALFPLFFAVNVFLCADRNESIFSAQTTIVATVIYVKFLYLLFKKQEILAFLNDPIVVHSIGNREQYQRTNKKIKKFMRFVRPYCVAMSLTTVLLITIKLPIFSTDKGLPAFISFSWNDSEIVYWVAYLFVSLSQVLYCTANFITVLIWYILLNYSLEYHLLGNELKNLGVTTKTKTNEDEKNEKQKKVGKNARSKKTSVQESNKFIENLIVLVKAHRNLTETIDRFRLCFSTLFLGQITTSSIIICASVYNLAFASKENFVQTQMFAVTLLYGIFDIFLVTYLANDVTIASHRLSYCLFESNWIDQTESCKRYVLIMGEVLKQPQQLVVLVYPMNLETFVKIINGTYSMFNILKQFQ